jgi:hypothetical protein
MLDFYDEYDSIEQACAYEVVDDLRELLAAGKSVKYVQRYKAQVLREYKKTYESECWDEFVSHLEGAFSRLIKQHKRFS